MYELNETHETITSWVESANLPDCDFPIQNLPFGVFRRQGSDEAFRGGVAIGDQILDLAGLHATGLIAGRAGERLSACLGETLNPFMALGPEAWSELRLCLSRILRADTPDRARLAPCLVPQNDAEYRVPARIGDYTDFYTSIHHATNVGRLFRPDNPLMPNYQWVPIGYHGRSSSIVVSGQQIRRPQGQTRSPGMEVPVFGPSQRVDYELELGIFIGPGNPLGSSVNLAQAEDQVFGICLLNDWSARDIQAWEYQPLGPFLSKSFASSISPWILTAEALRPYRVPWSRPEDHPQPLPYLESAGNRTAGAFDINLEVLLQTRKMQASGDQAARLSLSNFRNAYWTVAQMVTHHTVNGCNLQPGDLLGSGTQSGPGEGEGGALLELTQGGKNPLALNNGETRKFLEDGDAITLRGWCEKPGHPRIGFGEAVGELLPALD
ncbi:MAG: fumarylacetoacetase [Gammaproteobacteria bacterium]|nr:fumarylacetoacetase [Gammaproteobacteria bacterium]